MKDKLLKLATGEDFYVLEELTYKDNRYVIGTIIDKNSKKINENELIIFKVVIYQDKLSLDDILDEELATIVSNLFLNKMRNNK